MRSIQLWRSFQFFGVLRPKRDAWDAKDSEEKDAKGALVLPKGNEKKFMKPKRR